MINFFGLKTNSFWVHLLHTHTSTTHTCAITVYLNDYAELDFKNFIDCVFT